MNWSQIISTVIFVSGVFVSVLEGIYWALTLTQKLPNHRAERLEQFAKMAVHQVEQQNGTSSGSAKKLLATATVLTLFKDFDLPMPTQKAIDIAIESSVFFLSRITPSDIPLKTVESPQQSK